jgi:hypothetical protein
VDKLEKISLIGLLLLALLLSGLLVYFRKELILPPESKNPFPSVHVAEIRIVIKEDDWQRLKTLSYLDERVSIHYQHREISASDKVKFTNELTKLAGPGDIEFFAG